MSADLGGEHELLPIIDRIDGRNQLDGNIDRLGEVDNVLDILGEAAAAVSGTGKEELETNALIMSDAAANFVDVGAKPFAQVRHLVDEADFGGEHGIGNILGHLRA